MGVVKWTPTNHQQMSAKHERNRGRGEQEKVIGKWIPNLSGSQFQQFLHSRGSVRYYMNICSTPMTACSKLRLEKLFQLVNAKDGQRLTRCIKFLFGFPFA